MRPKASGKLPGPILWTSCCIWRPSKFKEVRFLYLMRGHFRTVSLTIFPSYFHPIPYFYGRWLSLKLQGIMNHQTGSSILQVTALNVFYGTFHAVRDVGFEVKAGEIFGLLGPNG